MVAHFYRGEERGLWPQKQVRVYQGLSLLSVAVPSGYSPRSLERCGRRLFRQGVRRALAEPPGLVPAALEPVSPLPLCRAMGAELVLALLSGVPLRERRVALRGEAAGPEAWHLAELLCPRVGALLLDFDRGEEPLSRRLRERFGAAPLHLGQGQPPQAAVELEPRPFALPRSLRLWGEPELLGLTLRPEEELPPELPGLPFLELLWETGRIEPGKIRAEKPAFSAGAGW